MNINIEDYVNHSEIKEAILEGLKGYARDNAERVISNCGHRLATGIVNEYLGETAKEKITEKTLEVIGSLSDYTLFSNGGYGYPASEARKMLDQSVRDNKETLDKACKSAIHNLSKKDVVEVIKSGNVKLTIG